MWVLPVKRRELVDLITPNRGGDVPGAVEENRPSFDIVRSDVMAAVWPAQPAEFGRLPTAIIVPEGARRDSLAWLATYVRDLRPFTAFCRVVERPIAERFLKGPSAPNLMGAEGVCSGLVLGEALTHARGRTSILDLPAATYSATLSHSISRTFALTAGSVAPHDVARYWMEARQLTGQDPLGVPADVILAVWSVALGSTGQPTHSRTLFEPSNILAAAWLELTTIGEIRDPVWHRLVEGYPALESMRDLLQMPREQRVHVIDTALRLLVTTRRETDERPSFLAGYFTSLLAPGTLDHADILAPVASLLPTAYLWYGLCAGNNLRGDALPVGNSLARRIVRDLTIPDRLVDRPRCDVALEELTMHGPGDKMVPLTTKSGRLDIDILPGVTMAVRWPTHDVSSEDQRRRARDKELQQLLIEMEDTTTKWRHLTERLRDLIDRREGDLRPNTRKKRGGK
ncbi:MAG: hypothetical protein JXB13_09945 [Phycisphaerae bacterium]|nr:hypothetical protein [Phycisphaerae bacterium]